MLSRISVASWIKKTQESTKTSINQAIYNAAVSVISEALFSPPPKIIVELSAPFTLPGHTTYGESIIVKALEESLGNNTKRVLVSSLLEDVIDSVAEDLGLTKSVVAMFLSAKDDVPVKTLLSQVSSIGFRAKAGVNIPPVTASGSMNSRRKSESEISSILKARDVKRLVYTEFSRRLSMLEDVVVIDSRPGSYESWVALTTILATPLVLYIRYALVRPKLALEAIRNGASTLSLGSLREFRELTRAFLGKLAEEAGKEHGSRDFASFVKYVIDEGLSQLVENLILAGLDTSIPLSLFIAGTILEKAYEYTLEDLRKSYGYSRITGFSDALRLASRGEINIPRRILKTTVMNNIQYAYTTMRGITRRLTAETGEKGFDSYVKIIAGLARAKSRVVRSYMLALTAIASVSLLEGKIIAVDERTIASLMGTVSSEKIKRIITASKKIGLVYTIEVNEHLVVIPARVLLLASYSRLFPEEAVEEAVEKTKKSVAPLTSRDIILRRVVFATEKDYGGLTGYLVDKLLL